MYNSILVLKINYKMEHKIKIVINLKLAYWCHLGFKYSMIVVKRLCLQRFNDSSFYFLSVQVF